MDEDYKRYSFENAETRYKIETADKRLLKLYLNANKLAYTLYDILNWKSALYNGKIYDEGHVLYKGKTYTRYEWDHLDIPKEDKDEYGMLKEEPLYYFTEDDIIEKLNYLTADIIDAVNDYME